MQCNACPPKIDIWTDARYGAYRWYKIENLQKKRRREKTNEFQAIGLDGAFFFFLFRQIYERVHTDIPCKMGLNWQNEPIGVGTKNTSFQYAL